MPLRRTVERRSAPVLLWLSSRPRFVLPVLVAVLLIGGLAAPTAYALPLLLVLGVLLLWLSYLSWPALDGRARLLRAAYALTAAEADVALLLCEGLEPAVIAQRRGCAVATVRSQMKALFAKTHTERQVELVARLHRLL